MKIIRIVLIFFILANTKFGIAQKGWLTFKDEISSIRYPKEWELIQPGDQVSFIILAPSKSASDMFRENINFLIQDWKGKNFNLDTYSRISIEQIPLIFNDTKVLENKRIKRNGRDCQYVSYTATEEEYKFRFEQYYWFVNDKAYVLTGTCEESEYSKYNDIMKKMLDSFKLKFPK